MSCHASPILPCPTAGSSNTGGGSFRRPVVVSGNRDRVRPQFPLPDIAPRRRDRNPAVHVQPSPGKQRALFGDRPRDDRERRQRKGHRQPGLEGDQATAPVFCGGTLYAESEVLEKRESKLRPTQGIVTVHTRAFNQDGVQVMEFVRSALIPKRGHGVDDKH